MTIGCEAWQYWLVQWRGQMTLRPEKTDGHGEKLSSAVC